MRFARVLLCLVAVGGLGCPDLLYDFDGDGSEDGEDCAPGDPWVFPGAEDLVDPEGLDTNCDGADGVDADGDGHASLFSGGDDCNDDDAGIHPASSEVPDDGQDNDCVGGDATCDGDQDGVLAESCGGADCDDTNNLAYPGAGELCNGVDDDCDGVVPPGERDADADAVMRCAGDCDDTNGAVGPAMAEACDGIDTDCDGTLSSDESDLDGDGVLPCGGDCDDEDPTRVPGALEGCDGVDTDCDGAPGADEADADGDGDPACRDCDDLNAALHTWDADADSFSPCDGDCDDLAPTIRPGGVDAWGDSVDGNCDGVDGLDADGDSWPANGIPPDCDDDPLGPDASTTWPGAPDVVGDAVDQDCDGLDGVDSDGDGVASLASGGADCNDDGGDPLAPLTFPGADDPSGDGVDGDCDGVDGVDSDGDGVASTGSGGTDCNDDPTDPIAQTIWPGADDVVGDAVDQNCDGVDGVDADGDGVASLSSGGADCNDDGADPLAAVTFPGAGDGWGDGEDTDCDGMDGVDRDADGWAVNGGGGDQDCDDANAAVYPGSAEVWESPAVGRDTDCDGAFHTTLAQANAMFTGATPWERSGLAVAGAGDVDGDGLADLLIGAPTNHLGGGYAGVTYLVLGSAVMAGGTMGLQAASVSFVGASNDCSGHSVAGAGDVDGDGLDDVLIGAPRGCGQTVQQPSRTYLVFGSSLTAGGTLDLSQADVTLLSEDWWDQGGASVSSAGDVDGDGLADVLIGAPAYPSGAPPGKAYLMLGSTIAAGGTFSLAQADAIFVGTAAGGRAGAAVSAAGDVDGDGQGDILIGAPSANRAHLLFGSDIAVGGVFDLAVAGTTLLGQSAVTGAGAAVASAGDVDGDGLGDLLVAASGSPGPCYLLLGSTVSGSGASFDLGQAALVIYPGQAVSSAGDVDGDGLADLLLGVRTSAFGGTGSGLGYKGLTHLVSGATALAAIAAGGVLRESLDETDATFVGEAYGDSSGTSVAGVGDVNGDGFDDLLIGAPGNDEAGNSAGKSYLLFGRP